MNKQKLVVTSFCEVYCTLREVYTPDNVPKGYLLY